VKASVRYNSGGKFNQSPDNRRAGMAPATMRENILATSSLLRGRTVCSSLDYREALARATGSDLVYMDPPYQGVSAERDTRYLKAVLFEDFVDALEDLNARGISYIVSYDGRTGEKIHGRCLPNNLGLRRIELKAGRSSQATLLGRVADTVESLYLSPALIHRSSFRSRRQRKIAEQLSLVEGG
jgi:DNA adenine methylase